MTQYNTLNGKLLNSLLDKLKSGIKNDAGVRSNLSLNVIGESNYQTNIPYKLILTERQLLKFHKSFSNNSSAITKLYKTVSFWVGFFAYY